MIFTTNLNRDYLDYIRTDLINPLWVSLRSSYYEILNLIRVIGYILSADAILVGARGVGYLSNFWIVQLTTTILLLS